MALSMNEAAAQVMEHLVTCKSHGYSQISRLGIGGKETIKLSDGTKIKVMKGDRDCSSAVIDAYCSVGLPLKGATYTGNMRKAFVNTGLFRWHPGTSYSAKRGDIYLNEACHTAMCVSPYGSARGDKLAEFAISELGTIDGKEGDQTGHESHVRGYYNYPWDGILEYVGKDVAKPTKPKPTVRCNIAYALKVRRGGWLNWIKNYGKGSEGFAGLPHHQHDAFKAKATRGTVKYRIHKRGAGWTKWAKNGQTLKVNGAIDGIQTAYTPPKNYPKQRAYSRSQTTERVGWLDWCNYENKNKNNRWCGIYGEALDRLQMRIK